MANYVSNDLRLIGKTNEVKKCLEFIQGPGTALDFKKILPPPEELTFEEHPEGWAVFALIFPKAHQYVYYPIEDAFRCMETLEENKKWKAIETALKFKDNINKYGYPDASEWVWEKWGSKCNAIDSWAIDNVVGFETAWTPPYSVVAKLSEIFPSIVFRLGYSIENDEKNNAIMVYKNGESSMFFPEDLTSYRLMEWYKGYFPKSTLAGKIIDKRLDYALCD